MELVYLWVEEYKNIHRQGFNFSPQFRCDYNPDTNELTIDENEDCTPGFFGENINVMAIVGKNGSGKSSVIKIIFLLMYLYSNRDVKTFGFIGDDENSFMNKRTNIFNILDLYNNLKTFLVIKDEDTFFKIDLNRLKNIFIERNRFSVVGKPSSVFTEIEVNHNGEYVGDYSGDISSFFIYFNNSIDTFKDNRFENWIEELYHRTDEYSSPLLIEPAKYDDTINLQLQNNLSNQRLLLFYQLITSDEISDITTFFNPDKIRFDYAQLQIDPLILRDIEQQNNELFGDEASAEYGSRNQPIIEKMKENPYKIVGKYINYEKVKIDSSDLFSEINFDFIGSLYALYKNKDFKLINLLYIAFKSIEKQNYGLDDSIKKIDDAINTKSIETIASVVEETINNEQLIDKDKLQNNEYKVKKIKVAIEFYKNKHYEKLSKFDKQEISLTGLPDDILNVFPAWIEVEFFEREKSLSSLSTGEKFKFKFLTSLLYQLHNLSLEEKYQSIYLFFDEVEMGFHPDWQRRFLSELLHSLKGYEKLLQTYFLTHSPFLLSDIPKQNIIFLDKDENGNCIMADGLHDKQETFGQNIHTLLSDSFFMEDGLMGEFAKSKINEIIDFHKEVEKIKNNMKAKESLRIEYEKEEEGKPSIKTRFWHTQSIIGDAYLKQVIKNHLVDVETILLGKERAKQEEIKRLRDEADRLEKLS